jgi:hypothetical protein
MKEANARWAARRLLVKKSVPPLPLSDRGDILAGRDRLDAEPASDRLDVGERESKMAVSQTRTKDEDVRYDFDAVRLIDVATDRLYDLWVGLALEHARRAQRSRVTREDISETLQPALDALMKQKDELERGK